MEQTIGKRIADLRRSKGLTQDDIAEALGVSGQAVSKWENDISYPDISLLTPLAALLDVSVDRLLSPKKEQASMTILPPEQRRNIDDLILKIVVDSGNGDKVRVNLPIPLVRVGLEIGMEMPQISGNSALQGIDIEKILLMIEKGAIGKLVEIESADGDNVVIVVE